MKRKVVDLEDWCWVALSKRKELVLFSRHVVATTLWTIDCFSSTACYRLYQDDPFISYDLTLWVNVCLEKQFLHYGNVLDANQHLIK